MRFVYLIVFLALAPVMAWSQDMASLVADQIAVDPSGRVEASGNVEVRYGGTVLTASRVSYARDGDRLTIEGPIKVVQPDGTVFFADYAELDRDLSDGILRSARAILDQQLQMAAQEIARVGDRYVRFDRVVASSCEICANNPTPLWEIRAGSVVHDQDERQLYFSNAQFRIAGVPVFYFPRLRLPDPTLERARGFLMPGFRVSSNLGTGIKVPYFFPIGRHADLTVTPYLSSSTTTLEFSFRRNHRGGSSAFQAAVTDDDIDGQRGYFFGELEHQLPKGFVLDAQVELVSDPGYLYTYGYSEKDRLTNRLSITRVRDKDLFRSSVTEFRTLRGSELAIEDTLPDQFIELYYQRDLPELAFGGKTVLSVESSALSRPSSTDVSGRDVSRIGTSLEWSKDHVFSFGAVSKVEVAARVDAYNVGQDSTFQDNLTRFVPRGAVELRWPFARTSRDGGREILEPVIRVDVAEAGGDAVPLEDSTVVEFDEANLFSYTRYPGVDGVEDGARVALGVAWRRNDPSGHTFDFALGRVTRLDGDLGYGAGSGLQGDQSELLLAARMGLSDGLFVTSRTLFDETFDLTLSESRVDWATERYDVGSSYIFAVPEPSEGRTTRLSEWSFDGSYALNDRWTASADWRYDFTANRAARTTFGLEYQNECIDVDFSMTRRYADSSAVDPTTDVGFRVSLAGVGNGSSKAPRRRSCRG